jgi:replicative DNA helicase
MAYKPKPIAAGEMTKQWLAWQHKRHENPELYAPKSTGLRALNVAMGGGIEFGQYILIGGDPGAGKTTLLGCISDAFGRQMVNSLSLSNEMSTMQLGTLFFSMYSKVDRTRIRAAKLEIADWEVLEIAGKEIDKLTLAFDYGFSSVGDIHLAIDDIEERTGEPVMAIFGDYFHLMDEPNFRGPRTEEEAYISRNLNALKNSKDKVLRAVVFAAQKRKQDIERGTTSMAAFHGSSQLSKDMDIGIFIDNIPDEVTPGRFVPNRKKVTIVKGRELASSEPFEVGYNGSIATFYDLGADTKEQAAERYWK